MVNVTPVSIALIVGGLFLAGVLVVALPGGADSNGACGTGKQHQVNAGQSIQAAINAAKPGDAVVLGAGTFNESVNITVERLLLKGTEGTILRSGDLWNVRISASGVCVADFFTAGPAKDSVLADHVLNLTIRNVTVTEASGAGVLVNDTTGVVLRGVRTNHVGVNGAVITRSQGILVENSQFSSNRRGLHLEAVGDATVINNTATGVVENGIVVERGSQITVSHNLVRDAFWGIWILQSADVTLEGNDIGFYHDLGLRIEGTQRAKVLQGGVHNGHFNSSDAIKVSASGSVSIIGTRVNDVVGNGLLAIESPDLTVDGLRTFSLLRGVHVVDSARFTIKNVHVQDTIENGLVIEDSAGPSTIQAGTLLNNTWGMWLLRTHDVNVVGTIVEASRDRGARVEDANNILLDNVTVRAGSGPATGIGVDVFQAANVKIQKSDISAAAVTGVLADRVTAITVSDTLIHTSKRAIRLLRPNGATISGNDLNLLGEDGIVFETGTKVTVSNNKLSGGTIGIYERTGPPGADNQIVGNTITGYSSSGISLDLESQDTLIGENTITFNVRGIHLVDGDASKPDQRVANNLMRNNTITDNEVGIWSEDTHGPNTVRGGLVDRNKCDFFLLGDTHLKLEGVGLGGGATTNNASKISGGGPFTPCGPVNTTSPPAPPPGSSAPTSGTSGSSTASASSPAPSTSAAPSSTSGPAPSSSSGSSSPSNTTSPSNSTSPRP